MGIISAENEQSCHLLFLGSLAFPAWHLRQSLLQTLASSSCQGLELSIRTGSELLLLLLKVSHRTTCKKALQVCCIYASAAANYQSTLIRSNAHVAPQ